MRALAFSIYKCIKCSPVLVLLFVALWFVLRAICFVSCLVFFVLVFFGHFGLRLPRLGGEVGVGVRGGGVGVWKGGGGAGHSAFRTFVRFALVWFCLFPLRVGVWEGLRFVIVAFPGLFSYLFFAMPV